jgi:tRNA dimethylallyltransferase
MKSAQPLIALLGPTAVGKTALSLFLAERLPLEIVSVDSRLLYRGMDIGTDKPSEEDLRRVPHHLVNVADPRQPWSMARYLRAARRAIGGIHSQGRVPLLVGGTGQYLTALLEGWMPPPLPPDDRLRAALQKRAQREGIEALHRELAQVDPYEARRIDPRNLRRLIRALEIYQLTGKAPSELRRKEAPPWEVLKVGLTLPREELYRRIDARIERMLQRGWLEEVRRLLEAGCSPDLPSFSAIGYAQLAQVVAGQRSLEEAVEEIRRLSRQFVRRQHNWFHSRMAEVRWFEARPGVEKEVMALVKGWLEEHPPSEPAEPKEPQWKE